MTTYYLDPNGSDGNSGSSGSPWYSFNAISGSVAPGDTVIVRDGTYNYDSYQRLSGSDGTSNARVTVRAADGASPTVSFGGSSGGGWSAWDDGAIGIENAYWTLEGITVTDSPYHGIVVKSGGTNATVRGCTAHGNHLVGIIGENVSDGLFVENCVTYDNNGSTSSGGDSDGIQFIGCSNGTIHGCRTYNNGDDGIDLWQTTNTLVENCRAYENGRDGGDGNGFKMGGGSPSGNNTVQRSLAWSNRKVGFNYNYASQACYFYNNTAWNNQTGFLAENGSQLYNNIAYENGSAISSSNVDESTNSWDLGIADPQFETTNPSIDAFLRPAADSPVIEAGTDIGLSYDGASPTLGALAHDGGSSTGGSIGPTLRYHDGSEWVDVAVRQHDGDQFV